jgi:hypothetical protein
MLLGTLLDYGLESLAEDHGKNMPLVMQRVHHGRITLRGLLQPHLLASFGCVIERIGDRLGFLP